MGPCMGLVIGLFEFEFDLWNEHTCLHRSTISPDPDPTRARLGSDFAIFEASRPVSSCVRQPRCGAWPLVRGSCEACSAFGSQESRATVVTAGHPRCHRGAFPALRDGSFARRLSESRKDDLPTRRSPRAGSAPGRSCWAPPAAARAAAAAACELETRRSRGGRGDLGRAPAVTTLVLPQAPRTRGAARRDRAPPTPPAPRRAATAPFAALPPRLQPPPRRRRGGPEHGPEG